MSNWVSLSIEDLYAAKAPAIIDAARQVVTSAGAADPVPEVIADVVSRIRGALVAGGKDIDTSKIPRSLRALAVGMAVRKLKALAEMDLSAFEQQEQKSTDSWLLRITDEKLVFEIPDVSAGAGEMQAAAPSPLITKPHRQFSNRREDGL
jgi:hypothetical protein